MTRKDYTQLAAELASLSAEIDASGNRYAWAAFVDTVRTMMNAMKRENGRFDADRFARACGIADLSGL